MNLFGWFDNDDAVFLAMEYFPCGGLAKYIPNGFSENETKTITSQLLEGLEIMHANNFAHRDLKPHVGHCVTLKIPGLLTIPELHRMYLSYPSRRFGGSRLVILALVRGPRTK